MNYKLMREIERKWTYEHSHRYISKVNIEKIRLQRERDGHSLDEIAKEFLPFYK